MRRFVLVLVSTALAVLALAGPAAAKGSDRDDFVVLKGDVLVPEGESRGTVVVFDGSVTIDGAAEEVVAFNGPVTISGSVEQDVVAFNGTVTVASGASIGGDLVSRREAVVEEGATVGGEIRRSPGELFREPFPFFGRVVAWLAVTVSILALGLLFIGLAPRAADAVDVAWRTAPWPAVGWGLLLLIGLPLLAVLAFITLVGIPFGVGLGLGLFLIFAFGYTAGAWVLGRRLVRAPSSRIVAFLAGLAILRLLAFIPIAAGIIGTIAVVIGLGSLAVAMWRARRPAPVAPAPAA